MDSTCNWGQFADPNFIPPPDPFPKYPTLPPLPEPSYADVKKARWQRHEVNRREQDRRGIAPMVQPLKPYGDHWLHFIEDIDDEGNFIMRSMSKKTKQDKKAGYTRFHDFINERVIWLESIEVGSMATRSSNVHVHYDNSESEDDFMADGRNTSYERCLSPGSFQGHSFPMSISWTGLNPKHHHKSSNWVWKCDKRPDPVAEDSRSNTAEHHEPFDWQGHLPLAGMEPLSTSSSSAQPPSFRSIEQPPMLPPLNALSQPSSITAPSGSHPPRYSRQRSPSPFQQPYDSHSSCHYASFRRSNSHSLSPHRLTP
jgi:hypothetical protein